MKICYLGLGAWGFCLANMLASKGYDVTAWTIEKHPFDVLNTTGFHPAFPDVRASERLKVTMSLEEALDGADALVESVTSAGIRGSFEQVKAVKPVTKPIILTSKGIEQGTGLILGDVVAEVLGEESKNQIGCLSGPSYAVEVVRGLPTSVVAAAYNKEVLAKICEIFQTPHFRVYPNADIRGVAFGGALKNVIAIACGIGYGLRMGQSSQAALMTRGLHEMCKLAVSSGCRPETLYGLSGMGDLCVTCSSTKSRNFSFGALIANGKTTAEALKEIGMVVEGAYTCVSALQLSRKQRVSMPITESVHRVIYEGLHPRDAVKALMARAIKEEHL